MYARRHTMAQLAVVLVLLAGCQPATTTPATPVPPTPTETPVPPAETATPAPTETATPLPTNTPTPLPPLTGRGGGVIAFVSSLDVYLMNADGTDTRQLTTHSGRDAWPTWSPDGEQIAFMSERSGSWNLYVMSVDEGESSVQRLTSSSTLNWEPAWSPDGAWIAFGSMRNSNSDIYLISARTPGGDERRLTTHRQVDGYACWSPDSSQLAFVSDRDGNWEIYVMNADGSNARRLTTNDADDWDPDWSPDGTQIAFASRRDGNMELYVVNTNGSDLRRLTEHPAEDMSPSWSPDGSRIAFHREEGGRTDIYLVNADGGNLHKLAIGLDDASNPVWRPHPAAPAAPEPSVTPTEAAPPPTDRHEPTPTVVGYAPVEMLDWEVSTPADEGLDPKLVADLYRHAADLPSLYGLLLVKNGRLIAEGYFNGGTLRQKAVLASVTKSYTSALVGIALDQGCLSSVDQAMIDFFPEFAGQIDDPRKEQITIGDMLKMRSGYPWEEFAPPYLDRLLSKSNWLPCIVEFPLTSDPGTEFGYSNLTAHLLAVIVARACDASLLPYGQQYLFSPINARVGAWPRDTNGYYYGSGDIAFTARDAAKFGLLYLKHGEYAGTQVVSADWVRDSLQIYSHNLYGNRLGSYFRDIGYGYLWWSARAGIHHFSYAWGHGGNLIVLLDELDMVIVTTANPLNGVWGQEAWEKEGAIIDLVGRFIKSMP